MKKIIGLLAIVAAVACGPKDGEYTFHLLTTNDVHGHYFDSLYVQPQVRSSLMAKWGFPLLFPSVLIHSCSFIHASILSAK